MPLKLQLPQPVLQLELSTDFSFINGIVLISLDMFTSPSFNYMYGVSLIYVIVFSGFIVSTSDLRGCLTTILIIILRQPLYTIKNDLFRFDVFILLIEEWVRRKLKVKSSVGCIR